MREMKGQDSGKGTDAAGGNQEGEGKGGPVMLKGQVECVGLAEVCKMKLKLSLLERNELKSRKGGKNVLRSDSKRKQNRRL